MSYGIRLVDLAGYGLGDSAPPHEMAGCWVKSYDADGMDGRGELVATDDPSEALVFPSLPDALEAYRKVSTVRPLRDDGKLNRPLTAWSISVQQLPKERPE